MDTWWRWHRSTSDPMNSTFTDLSALLKIPERETHNFNFHLTGKLKISKNVQ
jgi:hypothetical protein